MPLETQRLRLRALTVADAEEVFAIVGPGPTTATVSWQQPDVAAAESWVERRCAHEQQFGYSMWGVKHLHQDGLVGLSGFFPTDATNTVELGYVIHVDHWGQGLGTEAAHCAVQAMLTSGPRIVSTIRPTNLASINVAAKLGMCRSDLSDPETKNLVVFAIR